MSTRGEAAGAASDPPAVSAGRTSASATSNVRVASIGTPLFRSRVILRVLAAERKRHVDLSGRGL